MKKQILVSLFLVTAIVLTLFVGAASADTVFRGTLSENNTFTFDNSTLVKGVQLSDGSDVTQKVTCTTNGAFSFTIDAPGYEKNGNGKVYFMVPLENLDIFGVTWRGVQLYLNETPLTTYLYGHNSETAYYVADISSLGKFTIHFEEGASLNLPVQGDEASYLAIQKKKGSKTTTTTTTTKSPVPVLGIIAGLGAAVALAAFRRH